MRKLTMTKADREACERIWFPDTVIISVPDALGRIVDLRQCGPRLVATDENGVSGFLRARLPD